jgi:hypothetical protein
MCDPCSVWSARNRSANPSANPSEVVLVLTMRRHIDLGRASSTGCTAAR